MIVADWQVDHATGAPLRRSSFSAGNCSKMSGLLAFDGLRACRSWKRAKTRTARPHRSYSEKPFMPLSTFQGSSAQEAWLKSLLSTTVDTAVILLAADGEILGWLGASTLLFGYASEEVLGTNIARLFTPEDVKGQLDKQERQLAMSCGRSEDDRWHLRKDGSRFWGSGVMEQVRDADGGVIGLAKVLRDRTDVRTMVVSLQSRLLAAEQQNQDRLSGIAAVAHELRNQISPLSNLLTALEKTGGSGQATAAMRRQILTMARLINDLAEGSAFVAASSVLHFTDMNVQQVILHAANSLEDIVRSRNQTLKVTVPDTAITISADQQRINQILINLLTNASKFTPPKGTIQLSATVEDDIVAIRVEDDGVGISSEVLPKIFELFSRGEHRHGADGLGVGLTAVKRLAELHAGFVEARSPGRERGSVFTVRLPLRQPESAAAKAPTGAGSAELK